MKTHKKCKGINKCSHIEGCGNMVLSVTRKYGLCQSCHTNWLISDDPKAKETFDSFLIKNKQDYEKSKRIKSKIKKKEMKVKILSVDAYRAKVLQPSINKIARLIDYGNPCIATGNLSGKMAGGHYFSVGSNRTICLNLHNIFIQSFHSNSWKAGDSINYRLGIVETFGEDYINFIESLSNCPLRKNKKHELIEFNNICKEIIKELSLNTVKRTPLERISLRNEVNIRLGIYDAVWCEFKL